MKLNQNKDYVGASTLKERVGLYVPTLTPDGEGGSTTTYALQSTVWGDFRPNQGSRSLEDAALVFNQSARLFIRYGTTIENYYQVDVMGERWIIHSITDVGNTHQYLEVIIYK